MKSFVLKKIRIVMFIIKPIFYTFETANKNSKINKNE